MLVDALLQGLRRHGQLHAGIDAQGLQRIIRFQALDRQPISDSHTDQVGEVVFALAGAGLEPRKARPEEIGVEGVDADVEFADGGDFRRGFCFFDDRLDAPGAIADDAPKALRIGAGDGHHGDGGAGGGMARAQLAERGGAQQRHIAVED